MKTTAHRATVTETDIDGAYRINLYSLTGQELALFVYHGFAFAARRHAKQRLKEYNRAPAVKKKWTVYR